MTVQAAVYEWLFVSHPGMGLAIIYGSLNVLGDFLAQFFFSSDAYDYWRTVRYFLFGAGIAPLAGMWNAYLEQEFPLRPQPVMDRELDEISVPLQSVSVDDSWSSPSLAPREAFKGHLHRRSNSNASRMIMSPMMAGSPMLRGSPLISQTVGEAEENQRTGKGVNKWVLAKRLFVDQAMMAPISFVIFLVAMGLMEGSTPTVIYSRITRGLWSICVSNWKLWPAVQIIMFLYVPLAFRVPAAGVINVLWTVYLSWKTASLSVPSTTAAGAVAAAGVAAATGAARAVASVGLLQR